MVMMEGMDHGVMPRDVDTAMPEPAEPEMLDMDGSANAGTRIMLDGSTMPDVDRSAMPGVVGGDPFCAPGLGLTREAAEGGKFLSCADLKARNPLYPDREPTREIKLRATGNMEPYVWSIDDVKYEDAEPMVWGVGGRAARMPPRRAPGNARVGFRRQDQDRRVKFVRRSQAKYGLDVHAFDTLVNQARLQTPISTFFDTVGCVMVSPPVGPNRGCGVIGVHGLAPQLFKVNADLFASRRPLARCDADYEALSTNRIVLTPSVEIICDGMLTFPPRSGPLRAGIFHL